MTLKCINPDGISTPQTYSHVIVATGSRMVFIAGQVAEDSQGYLVGRGDMAAQARQSLQISGGRLPPPAPNLDRLRS
jgi:enamine deaminase RidA (YjgF/YER057c/UK114 family)